MNAMASSCGINERNTSTSSKRRNQRLRKKELLMRRRKKLLKAAATLWVHLVAQARPHPPAAVIVAEAARQTHLTRTAVTGAVMALARELNRVNCHSRRSMTQSTTTQTWWSTKKPRRETHGIQVLRKDSVAVEADEDNKMSCDWTNLEPAATVST